MSFRLRADRNLIRAEARSRRHLSVELLAPESPPQAGRLPVNLAFVIDRSGSMHGAKLANARDAVVQGIRSLRGSDRFTVVAYHDDVELVVAGTQATPDAHEAAVRPSSGSRRAPAPISTAAGSRAADRWPST